jgi:hypothetical protein
MSIEQENILVVQQLCEIVNNRDYDAIGTLFSSAFVDRNPAWSVANVNELKQIIASAHDALDQYITQDDIFAVDDRVVVLISFRGKHIGTFLGRMD